jgi:phage shock protein C
MEPRLFRSVQDRVIAGVCAGIGHRFGVEPSLVRLVWVVLGVLTGVFPMLVLYVLLAVVLPDATTPVHPVASFRPSPPLPSDRGVPGATPEHPYGPPPPDYARPGVPPAPSPASAWNATSPPGWGPTVRPAARAPRRAGRDGSFLFGAVLLGLGALFLLRELLRVDWDLVWPILLLGVGGWLVFRASRPRHT